MHVVSWAFSAVAAVERITKKIKTGKLTSLSEQQLVDCNTGESSRGCNDGWMDNAFKYIIQNQGLVAETNYPYQAMDGICDTEKASNSEAEINSFEDVLANNEEALLKAVASQPVSVTVDGYRRAFQLYSSGVFSGDCDTTPTLAVTVIG